MKLTIQVTDDSESTIFQQSIEIPDDIPFAPGSPVGGPITLWGLKTAIDYAVFEQQNKS